MLSLLLVSSATAVPQVHSQPVINKIERENKTENPLDFIKELTNYVDFDADRERVLKLKGKIDAFLADNKLLESNFKESSFYQSTKFQAFINKDGGLENDLLSLAEETSSQWEFYYNTYGEEYAREFVVDQVIRPFFEDFFSGDEYTNLLGAFEDDSQALADDMGKVYKARSKNVVENNPATNEESTVGTLGFVAESLLIGICTMIFLANWIVCGNVLGEATEFIVAMILALLLIIPAIIILATDVVVGNVYVAFEALIAAVITLLSVFAETLAEAVYVAGLIGFLVWGLAFILNLGLVPIEFFIVFVMAYFEYANVELGYIIDHLGPLITEILIRASENARDLWESIFGGYNNPSISPRFARFLARICDKFPVLKLLLSKCIAVQE